MTSTSSVKSSHNLSKDFLVTLVSNQIAGAKVISNRQGLLAIWSFVLISICVTPCSNPRKYNHITMKLIFLIKNRNYALGIEHTVCSTYISFTGILKIIRVYFRLFMLIADLEISPLL